MNLSQGIKKIENIEALARLWDNEDFKVLVSILRINQENFGKLCLTRNSFDDIKELQWHATVFSTVINTVEDCYDKLNDNKPKRRRKNAKVV